MSNFIDLKNFNGMPFHLYENNNVKNNLSNNMTGTFCESKLSEHYYSQSNIDVLQESIIKGVYKITNGVKICRQSEDELLIIMRSIFLQYAKHLNDNINNQINDLNKYVLKYSINNINTNIKQYQGYLKDITKQQEVMDKPQFVNIKGEKTLMPNHFI
mgnify:CR=1 FL=1